MAQASHIPSDTESVPNQLRELRIASGLKTRQLAELMGVSIKTVQAWESGRNGLSSKNLVKLSAILECTPNDLLGFTEDGTYKQNLRAVTPELDELIDLYLDNDLTVRHMVIKTLHVNARHPNRFPGPYLKAH